jgi:hypothetical protein
VATGGRYIREASVSVRSLRRHEPSLPVRVYTDGKHGEYLEEPFPFPSPQDLLEFVSHPNATRSWSDKPLALLSEAPDGERILVLDTDTRVCGSLSEVFELLDRFDLAAAHAPARLGPGQPRALAARAPRAFPELNTGVIAMRKSQAAVELLARWASLHEEMLRHTDARRLGDQATFRVALYESAIRFTVLPPEYNCRFTIPTYLHGPARILHGRHPHIEQVERELNSYIGPRVYVPGIGLVRPPNLVRDAIT